MAESHEACLGLAIDEYLVGGATSGHPVDDFKLSRAHLGRMVDAACPGHSAELKPHRLDKSTDPESFIRRIQGPFQPF